MPLRLRPDASMGDRQRKLRPSVVWCLGERRLVARDRLLQSAERLQGEPAMM